jgi:peptide/nickel transport system substrate-binding protein
VWVALGAGALVLVAIGGTVVARRRSSADDRE